MGDTFCTIITEDYMHQALTLRDSIRIFDATIKYSILIASSSSDCINIDLNGLEGIDLYFLDDIEHQGNAKNICKKYSKNKDALRWSLKPVLLQYLLFEKKFTKAIFLDSDLYFFCNYDFLFKDLDIYNIILSPHWRSIDPVRDNKNFYLTFSEGVFNGGFVGANQKSGDFLQWWARACEYECSVNKHQGMYVDQKFLDAVPAIFDNVGIIKNKGCNVANWNQVLCRRTVNPQGKVVINHKEPIVFIHFTNSTIKGILSGQDSHLSAYLEQYLENVNCYLKDVDVSVMMSSRKNSRTKVDRVDKFSRLLKKIIKSI